MEKRKEHVKKFEDYISALGNENIVRNHIAYFEKKIEDEISSFKEIKFQVLLSQFPNFAAWIRFYTEFISNKFFWRLFRTRGDWRKIDRIRYKRIIGEVENRNTAIKILEIIMKIVGALKFFINIVVTNLVE